MAAPAIAHAISATATPRAHRPKSPITVSRFSSSHALLSAEAMPVHAPYRPGTEDRFVPASGQLSISSIASSAVST
jgi:hypothetical protein